VKPDELMARAAASGIDLITTFEQSVPDGQERKLANYSGPIPKQTRVYRQPEWTAQDAAHACFGMAEHHYAAFAFRYAGDQSQRKVLKRCLMIRVSEIAKRDRWKRILPCANCEGGGVVLEIVKDPKTGKAIPLSDGSWECRPLPCPICRSFGQGPIPIERIVANGWQKYGLGLKRSAGQVFVLEQLVDLAIFEEWLTVHYVTGLLQLARDRLWAGLIGIAQVEWEGKVLEQYRQVQCINDDWCGTAYGMMNAELREDSDVA
jgi:hypothetical protein